MKRHEQDPALNTHTASSTENHANYFADDDEEHDAGKNEEKQGFENSADDKNGDPQVKFCKRKIIDPGNGHYHQE